MATIDTAGRAGFIPVLPADFFDQLPETGHWHQRGITHWHLLRDEQPIHRDGRPNPDRFDTARIQSLVHRSTIKVAHDPGEALMWLITQWTEALADCPDPARVAQQKGWGSQEGWLFALRCSWELLDGGSLLTPAGGGLETRANHSLDCHAYPMTNARCRRH